MYKCSTEFDSKFRPFYVYKIGNKIIGTLPADIDILYRKKSLNTMEAMKKVHEYFLIAKKLPSMNPMNCWYTDDNKLNKKIFRDFIDGLSGSDQRRKQKK